MNGSDLWKAMNYVNEQYLEDAQDPPQRRSLRWQSAAIAAVLVCALGTGLFLRQPQQAAPEAQADMSAPIMRSMAAPEEMAVRILEQEDGVLLCTVVESPRYTPGTQLRIVPPEEAELPLETLLYVTYFPRDGETIQALTISPEKNVSEPRKKVLDKWTFLR